RGRARIAVSDGHSAFEVGLAYTALDGDPSTPAGLLASLPTAQLITGRASFYVRLLTPLAKGVQRARGNRRGQPPDRPPLSGGRIDGRCRSAGERPVRDGADAGRTGGRRTAKRRRAPERRGTAPGGGGRPPGFGRATERRRAPIRR